MFGCGNKGSILYSKDRNILQGALDDISEMFTSIQKAGR